MSHNSYNPFNDDYMEQCYPSRPSPIASDETTDDIELYRRMRSMDSSMNTQQSPRRQATDPHPSITAIIDKAAGVDRELRTQRQPREHVDDEDERQRRRAERIYNGGSTRAHNSKPERSRRELAALPMLAEPLVAKKVPVKARASMIKPPLMQQKTMPSRQSLPPQVANGKNSFWSILWLLVTAAAAGYYYGKNGSGSVGTMIDQAMSAITDFRPSIEQFQQESQFNMTQPEDADRWPNNGQGLELKILFAADAKWYTYFVTAVKDWNNCSSLSLTTENVTVDPDCTPVDGVMKVCNKDWGATGWNGINYAMVDSDGYIASSVANMNEHYLQWSRDPQKQYVMCHEMGHGFGLPHSDESFWNKDLHTCMDYTMTPKANMHPNSDNYDYLHALYGSFANNDDIATGAPTASPDGSATIAPTISSTIDETADDDQRLLRNRRLERAMTNWGTVVSCHIEKYRSHRGENLHRGWRVLRQTRFAELHEYRLNDGISIRAYIVLAQ